MPEPVYDVLNVLIADQMGLVYPLARVSPSAMSQAYREGGHAGQPKLWSLEDYIKVTVYPRPDKDYPNCRVEYLVPPKVL